MASTTPNTITVATAIVTATTPWPTLGFATGSEAPVTIEFYKTSGVDTLLQGLGPNGLLFNLRPNEWASGYVNFYWEQSKNIVKWDLTQGGDSCCKGMSVAITSDVIPSISPSVPTSTATNSSSGNGTNSTAPTSSLVATAPTTIPSPTTKPAVSNGLKAGAVAGVAIGCLIAGALLAGLTLWVCWGRRRGRHGPDSRASATALMPLEKDALSDPRPVHSEGLSRAGADSTLPQPLEDQAISGEIAKIGNLIKNHVQSYYHSRKVKPLPLDHHCIMTLGNDLPITPGILSALLDDTATREVALRFCIAWAIVGRLQNYGTSSETLLPPELCAPMREISNLDTASKAHVLKVAHWRVTTAEFLRSVYVRDPFTASDSRNVAMLSLAQSLEGILRQFADSRTSNEERKSNLEEIIKRATLFAFAIFSQPSSWDFDWKGKEGFKFGELCIFPALVQVTNEAGERVTPPRPFSEAVIRKVEN